MVRPIPVRLGDDGVRRSPRPIRRRDARGNGPCRIPNRHRRPYSRRHPSSIARIRCAGPRTRALTASWRSARRHASADVARSAVSPSVIAHNLLSPISCSRGPKSSLRGTETAVRFSVLRQAQQGDWLPQQLCDSYANPAPARIPGNYCLPRAAFVRCLGRTPAICRSLSEAFLVAPGRVRNCRERDCIL